MHFYSATCIYTFTYTYAYRYFYVTKGVFTILTRQNGITSSSVVNVVAENKYIFMLTECVCQALSEKLIWALGISYQLGPQPSEESRLEDTHSKVVHSWLAVQCSAGCWLGPWLLSKCACPWSYLNIFVATSWVATHELL